jgi:multiple sugar transport system ATP-binding protein
MDHQKGLSMSSVSLQGIEKSYGSTTVLRDVNLDIADGEFLVLLGPSGCGKSTTMRMIAGLEKITNGTLMMGDRDVTNIPPRDRNIAMVFQNYALYPHMTVADNIGYPLKVAKIEKTRRREQIEEAAGKVDLLPYLDRYPRELSGGQRQRVALARALVRSPEVFLLDEPLSNLDAKLRVAMRAEIKHLQRTLGVTMIYVTHDQIEAMTLADRVVLLLDGEIQQVGTPDDIYDDPDNMFVAGFIGSPPMNFIEGIAQGGKFSANGISDLASPKDGNLTVGFRAEDAALEDNGRFSGTVFEVEPTGEATYIVLEMGKARVIIRTNKKFRPPLGEELRFELQHGHTLFFDTASGKRVRTGS